LSVPSTARSVVRALESVWWEYKLGVDTRGQVDATVRGGVHYSPLPYGFIRRLLLALRLTPDDVVADVGCGKGRVLCVARLAAPRRIIGIEANQALIATARRNLRRVDRGGTMQLVHGLAQDYDYRDVTALIMYNPFDRRTMEEFCERLGETAAASPRPLRIAYANCAFEQPLHGCAWLRRTDVWPKHSVAGFPHPTSFWEKH
jgi:SAM-dependent methyltransferase